MSLLFRSSRPIVDYHSSNFYQTRARNHPPPKKIAKVSHWKRPESFEMRLPFLYSLLAPVVTVVAKGGVYMCRDADFHGFCGWQPHIGYCQPVFPGASSIGPDKDHTCTLYKSDKCAKDALKWDLRYPGLTNMKHQLRMKGAKFDEAGSMKCRYDPQH